MEAIRTTAQSYIATAQQGTLTAIDDSELISQFIRFIDVKEASARTYKKAIRQLFVYLKENEITMPTREDVLAWRDSLKADHAPATIQTYIIAVRRFFQWLDASGYYHDITKGIKGAKVSKLHKRDYLTASQVKTLLATMPQETPTDKRNYAIVLLMITCGLRDIEVSRALVGDMRTHAAETVLYVQGKGHDEKDEFISVPDVTEQAIRTYLATREKISASSPIFTSTSNNSKGKALTTRSISGIVKKALKSAGFSSDRLTAHSLRHTSATLALLNGCNIRQVQHFLRHTSINTTEIYAHDMDATNNPCSNTIANLFNA